ncbi:hypothetical protein HW132_19275 [Brasilonema sp. CT11]|nr:hypothetical protein [Brasilonema sp. CT11]
MTSEPFKELQPCEFKRLSAAGESFFRTVLKSFFTTSAVGESFFRTVLSAFFTTDARTNSTYERCRHSLSVLNSQDEY